MSALDALEVERLEKELDRAESKIERARKFLRQCAKEPTLAADYARDALQVLEGAK